MEEHRKTSKFKAQVVLELLKGENLEELSRKYAVTMSEINAWRDEFIFTDLTYGVRSNTGSSMKTCIHRAMSPMKKIKKSHEIHMETKFIYFCTSN